MSTSGFCGLKPLIRRKCHVLEESLLQTVKKSKKPKKKHSNKEDKRKQTGISLFGAGKFVQKLMELQKKILAFMDILDLTPCDNSTLLDELVITTLEALQSRYPEVISSSGISKIEHASIEKGLDIFLNALKSLALSWIEHEGMAKFKHQFPPLSKSSNTEELVETTMGMLDFTIKIASEKYDTMDEDDDQTNKDNPESGEDFLMGYYLPDKVSSLNSSSPATPTSVLSHLANYQSKGGRKFSCPSPLLYSLKVPELRRSKHIDRLSLPMLPRDEAETNDKLDESVTRRGNESISKMEESDMTEEPQRCNEAKDTSEVPRIERDEQNEAESRVAESSTSNNDRQPSLSSTPVQSTMLSQHAHSLQPQTPPRPPPQPPSSTAHPVALSSPPAPPPPPPPDKPPVGTIPPPPAPPSHSRSRGTISSPPPPPPSTVSVEPQQNAEPIQMPQSPPKSLHNASHIQTPPPPPHLSQLQNSAPIQMPQNAAATQMPPPSGIQPQEPGLTDEAPASPSSLSQASRLVSTTHPSPPPPSSPPSPHSGSRSVSEASPTSSLMPPKKSSAPPSPATPVTNSTAPLPPPTQPTNGAAPAPSPPATPMTNRTGPPPPPAPTELANGPAPAPPPPATPTTNSTAPPPPPSTTQSANGAAPAPPPPTPMTNSTARLPPPPPTQPANGAGPAPPPTTPTTNSTSPPPRQPANDAVPAAPTPPPVSASPPPPPPMQPSNTAAPPPPPPATPNSSAPPPPPPAAPNSSAPPPPPPAMPNSSAPPPPPPGMRNSSAPPPPPPGMRNSSAPPPPPPIGGKANGAAPPPPPGSKGLGRKKANSKLQRSSQVGNLYRTLKRKLEGSSLQSKSSASGTKNAIGASSGGKQGLADALVEMTQRSSYFQQIEEDIQKYSEAITKLKSTISNFEAKDNKQLVDFHKDVESVLEKLTDESQVLSKFEGFPMKKLEAIRMAAALYTKLDAILSDLQNSEANCPLVQVLDKSERYFNKIKSEIDAIDRTKDEEAKKLQTYNIHFDFHIIIRIKEAMVDVSSNCMELALKERHNEAKNNKAAGPDLLWKTFQFAFKVYSFAGGHDERAEKLIKELYQEIEVSHQTTDDEKTKQ